MGMSRNTIPRETLQDLPPTAAFVGHVLAAADGSLSRAAIEERTGRPERSIRKAVDELRERDLVAVEVSNSDPNVRLYRLCAD